MLMSVRLLAIDSYPLLNQFSEQNLPSLTMGLNDVLEHSKHEPGGRFSRVREVKNRNT